MPDLSLPLIVVVIVVIYLLSSIKILAEYERGVIFRLGRVLPQPKGPGVILVFRPIDRMVRLSLRTEAMEVPSQDVVTRDNVVHAMGPSDWVEKLPYDKVRGRKSAAEMAEIFAEVERRKAEQSA